ncbi:300_t:CDS:2 [Entrophospora sp. SA101]|nr:300_t:CDS:2 [Entrophospora sp. SA101]CAJ0826152.1 3699_t:CDS:2 [Entrophospora sp. SA101]
MSHIKPFLETPPEAKKYQTSTFYLCQNILFANDIELSDEEKLSGVDCNPEPSQEKGITA